MPSDLLVRGDRVLVGGELRRGTIHIRDGKIAAIDDDATVPPGGECLDAGSSIVMAGLVDTHVHVNEPGRTEWEGFRSATRAAAAGGTTTVVDMPLNSVPATTTVDGLARKVDAARGQTLVDVGFWGGVVPAHLKDVAPLYRAGVLGFKCFLVPSGVDEFPHVGATELRRCLPELAALDAVLQVHAELPGPIERALARSAAQTPADPRRQAEAARQYHRYLDMRPAAAECDAIALLIELCREYRGRLHVVHVSSAGAVALLHGAQAEGLPVSAETCPHYLWFAADEVPDGATEYKCAPPIRTADHREALWDGLRSGTLTSVVSDHSPAPPTLKCVEQGDFLRAWGGIASLQLRLPVTWTGARARGIGVETLSRWLSEEPARLAGLRHRKGAIEPGLDADLVVWDPDQVFEVRPAMLYHRHALTPYAGVTLSGVVQHTILRGRRIYSQAGGLDASPAGELLLWSDHDRSADAGGPRR